MVLGTTQPTWPTSRDSIQTLHFAEERGRVGSWCVHPKNQNLCITTKSGQIPLVVLSLVLEN